MSIRAGLLVGIVILLLAFTAIMANRPRIKMSPQDQILANLAAIAIACDSDDIGTPPEQVQLRQAITYVRNLYGRTLEQHQEINQYLLRLALPTNSMGQALPEEPRDLVVGNLQTVSRQCGIHGTLLPEWGDNLRQAVEYIGNLRQVIANQKQIIKQLDQQLNQNY
jgi:hypothetical protein